MLQPGRHANNDQYRYGFQGQEMDNEIKGEGNSVNYKFRMHDPRLGRFFAIDPLFRKFPFYSPYQFSSNTPIMAVELEGLESSTRSNGNESVTPNDDGTPLPDIENPVHGQTGDHGIYVFVTNNDRGEKGMWIHQPDQDKINSTIANIENGIKKAREKGSRLAADNLQYWLDGKGGLVELPMGILYTDSYKKKKSELLNNFLYTKNSVSGKSMYDVIVEMHNGSEDTYKDYWSDSFGFSPTGSTKELYYAWNSMTLKGKGAFILKVSDNGVREISGEIVWELHDLYNWNPGGSTPMPSENGITPIWVNDNDLLEVEVCGNACSFEGRRTWSEKVSIKFDENNKVIQDNWE